MKNLFRIAALAALVLSIPSASFAAKAKASPAPSDAPSATPAAHKVIPFYYEVTTIDTAGRSFTHKNKNGKEVKFDLTDKTEIKNDKTPAKFEDIKVGDWVAGSRIMKSDMECEVVKITRFGPKTQKAEKPATPAAPAATPAKTS